MRNRISSNWLSRFAYLWALLIIVVACVMYYFGLTFADWAFLKDLGSVFAGAAVATILFNGLGQLSTEAAISEILSETLQRIIAPIRARATKDALWDYKWYVRVEQPSVADFAQDYLVQLVNLSYMWPEIPQVIRVACAVSNAAGALERWYHDPCKGLVWKIEVPGSMLDVRNAEVFSVGEVRLNERSLLVDKGRVLKVHGGEAKEHTIMVPKDLVGRTCWFSVEIRARIFDVKKGRAVTASQFYRPVMNGEFVYFIDNRIDVSEVVAITSEMTPILPDVGLTSSDGIWSLSSSKGFGRIVFSEPMDRGSAIRFEWYRK